jgi:hypothetical protein
MLDRSQLQIVPLEIDPHAVVQNGNRPEWSPAGPRGGSSVDFLAQLHVL